jgi:bifunctional DNA-binding transcriptional regulator/antitoxin component of YhaV-PrlF toxin-antitoxin module
MSVKKIKEGYELHCPILANGTITIPSKLRELVGRDVGQEIRVIVPEKQ